MSVTQAIADELRRSLSGPAWYGSSLLELLTDIDAATANARPVEAIHTIHEVVLHLTVWIQHVSAALNGGRLPNLVSDDDWPRPEAGANAWTASRNGLRTATEELIGYARVFPEDRLDETVPGRQYTTRILLFGVLQHAAYHAGQIAMLRKLARL